MADTRGNPSTGSFDVSITNTAPTIVDLPDLAGEATEALGRAFTFTSTGDDAEEGGLTPVCTAGSGMFPIGTTTVSCTVTDVAGYTASDSFTITVADTTAPALTLPVVAPAFAMSGNGNVVNYSATAVDIVDGARTVTCTPASGSTFPIAITTVNCSVADTRGNTSTGSFDVSITNSAPTIVDLPDLAGEATEALGRAFTFASTGDDAEQGAITPVCTAGSGMFPIGTTNVSCTVTDVAGYSASDSFTITVVDTTAPALTLPVVAPAFATSSNGNVVNYSATAVDIVDGARTVTCAPASGSTFPIATTTVNCSVADTRGNTSTGSFDVSITNTAPTIVDLPNLSGEATGASGRAFTFTSTGDDAEQGAITPVCSASSGTFAIGTTTVDCTVTDVAGYTASDSFTITVVDTTAPVLSLPTIAPAFATSAAGRTVNYTTSALDIVDASTAVTCSPVSGSTFPIATTTVNCSTSDTRGNTSNGSFSVTITNTAPTIVDLPNLAGEATSAAGRAFTFTSTGNDNEDGVKTPACTASSGTFPIGSTTVSCTVTDVAGYTASDSFTITVVDTTKPVVTVPANITTTQNIPAGRVVTYSGQSATDTVSPVTATCVPASGSTFAIGTTIVTCSATDAAGNTGTNTFSVTVNPTGTPTIGPGQTVTFSGGTVGGGVNVNGGTLILTNGTQVGGNVQMQPGSSLTVASGSSVGGNVSLSGIGNVTVTGGTIEGNLQLSNGATFNLGAGAVLEGQVQLSNTPAGRPASTMCGATVSKNVSITGNASPVYIGNTPACAGNTINGQVQITGNTGQIRVFGNMINKQLQCSTNTSITGGGNFASAKSGQCSAF